MTANARQEGDGGGGPLVSVIVPAFNAERTLRESVDSALAGTYRNIEVIVVDDGSADRTAELASHSQRTDTRVRLHQRRNGGVSAAFNSGFSIARGDYVARLDADDVWHPTKLEKQVALAVRQPDAAFIYAFVRYIDSRGSVIRDAPPQHFPGRAICRGMYENLIGANSSALIRRCAVAETGGYDESLTGWEDLLLQLTINARHPIAFVPEYLVGYRVRPGSLASNPQNMLDSWRTARRLLHELFPDVPARVHRWAHGRRCGELAEGFVWRGRIGAGLALLFEALRHDPEWTLHFLRYRLGRNLRRRTAPAEPAAVAFAECSPGEAVCLDPYDKGLEGKALHRLHERRTRLLAELDRELAERFAGSLPASRIRSGGC